MSVKQSCDEEPSVSVAGVGCLDHRRQVVHHVELALVLLFVVTSNQQIDVERCLKLSNTINSFHIVQYRIQSEKWLAQLLPQGPVTL